MQVCQLLLFNPKSLNDYGKNKGGRFKKDTSEHLTRSDLCLE